MVFDSNQAEPQNRARLFINGTLMLLDRQEQAIAIGQGLDLGAAVLCIGNQGTGGRSPLGSVFYAAYYDVALTSREVTENAQDLLLNDD